VERLPPAIRKLIANAASTVQLVHCARHGCLGNRMKGGIISRKLALLDHNALAAAKIRLGFVASRVR
jgi:hypothetical protein